VDTAAISAWMMGWVELGHGVMFSIWQ
jgi:hypothetical protein